MYASILICSVSQTDLTVVDTDVTYVWNQIYYVKLSSLMLSWWHVAFPQGNHLSSVSLRERADTWCWLISRIFFKTRVFHRPSRKHRIIRSKWYAYLKCFSAFSFPRENFSKVSILTLLNFFYKLVLWIKTIPLFYLEWTRNVELSQKYHFRDWTWRKNVTHS